MDDATIYTGIDKESKKEEESRETRPSTFFLVGIFLALLFTDEIMIRDYTLSLSSSLVYRRINNV